MKDMNEHVGPALTYSTSDRLLATENTLSLGRLTALSMVLTLRGASDCLEVGLMIYATAYDRGMWNAALPFDHLFGDPIPFDGISGKFTLELMSNPSPSPFWEVVEG